MTRGCSSDTPRCTCLCCTLLNLHNCYQNIFAHPCQMFPDYFQAPCRLNWDERSVWWYSQLVGIHYYRPFWFPDSHLICFQDALLLTLYDPILFYWTGFVILGYHRLLWRCCKFQSFNTNYFEKKKKKTWQRTAERADVKVGRGSVPRCILILDWQNDAAATKRALLEWSVTE